jgi:hypothetical protein
VAEIIAIRRHSERVVPHMSWFHREKPDAIDAIDDNAATHDEACHHDA